MISPDSPIETAKQDRLGRKPFIKSVAAALARFSTPDSFVIGMHGKWGTGKSSLLNLLVEQIENDNKVLQEAEQIHVMRFNPWNYSDQNQLVFQFLRQFRAHLKDNRKEFKDFINSIDQYADALAPPLELLPFGKVFSSGVKVGLKGAQKLFGTARDVDGLFAEITKQAKKLKRRTLVLIDDIDRLTAAETRQLFQLVKLTARFPYVIYVLAFDRQAVASALREVGVESGDEYLEKIVQVSFDIPPIAEARLTGFITDAITALVDTYKPIRFDWTRLGSFFNAGFRRWFRSLRDVRRFINGLEFGFGLIAEELNAVDFIIIEAIRIFHPTAFLVIREKKEIFAGHVDTFLENDGPEKFEATVNQILDKTGHISDDLKDVVIEMFPKLAYAYGRTKYGHESETSWEKDYRICSKRYFDAYFALTLSETEVSRREVTKFIEGSANQRALESIIAEWAQAGKLKNAIESLRFRLSEIPDSNWESVLGALLTAGDLASDKGVIFAGQLPEYWSVRWAIFDVLDLIPRELRIDLVKRAFLQSAALKTMTNVIALMEQLKKENKDRYPEFTDDDLGEMKSLVVKKIRQFAQQPADFAAHPTLPVLLGVWKDWGGSTEEIKPLIDTIISTDNSLLDFVDSFITQTHSSAGRTIKTKNRLHLKSLSVWIHPADLTERIKHVDETKLSAAGLQLLEFVRTELQRFAQTKVTPEQFDDNRFWED